MVELLSTKLYIPRVRANLVPRPHLTERLNAGLDKKLTLIAAPAGFGKTTLLSEWIPQSPRCVTWLSLDESDNDPIQFWVYFIASLQRLRPDLGSGALDLLQSAQSPPITSILTTLINDLNAFPDDFAIVLDDYHIIEYQPVHQSLTYLIAHQPENMHLVITTRVDPPLPLARLRARNNLTELRVNDFRFKANEAATFLNDIMGLKLTADDVNALEERTEGWIAGLQIAALSMQAGEETADFIQAFSGSHRHIVGYLADEVINQQPSDIVEFLVRTSILERLCGPLCDAITDKSDGQQVLERLEHANLFITTLDDEGRWYRYHHLFAEVLRARLHRTLHDQTSRLHHRAGEWYERQGLFDEAIQQELAGSNFEEAADLIERVAGNMLRKGGSATLVRWLKAMPVETVHAHPHLCLTMGWTHLWGPEFSLEGVDAWLQHAIQTAQSRNLLDPELTGEIAALQAMTATVRGDVAESREISEQALNHLAPESPWRSVITFSLGNTLYATGDLNGAARALQEAVQFSQADGTKYIQLIAGSFLAFILVYQGRLNQAMELYHKVLDWADSGIPHKGALMARLGIALILCERNQLEAASDQLESASKQLELIGGSWITFLFYRTRASVLLAEGNWKDALNVLNQAYLGGQKNGVNYVMSQSAALSASLSLVHGDLPAAAAWAASCNLDPNHPINNNPGFKDLEYLALARFYLTQGKHTEAISLLDRLKESAKAEGRYGNLIAILVLKSLVLQDDGESTLALECLDDALRLAEPEGYVRIFVDEGEPMRRLLADFQANLFYGINGPVERKTLHLKEYTGKLLATFDAPSPIAVQVQSTMLDPLSDRELEILHLISEGFSNKEIADQLTLEVSTVKTHINHMYGKLGTHKRTQAIAIAHEYGLLTH